MKSFSDRESTHQSRAVDQASATMKQSGAGLVVDNRPETVAQQALISSINASSSPDLTIAQRVEDEELVQGKFSTLQCVEDEELVQGKFSSTATQCKSENNTGLPDGLKAGVENLSGYSMDDVTVHYNSDKPSQLSAHAYAQGTDIHIAPGQEKHLPHETWHVAQQKQGRVQSTAQAKGDVKINDDAGLENEADVMGAKALQMKAGKETA